MSHRPAEPPSRWGLAATIAAPAVLALALLPSVWPGGDIASLDRWALSVLAVALLVLGFSLRRGAVCFGALAFVLFTGGGAQLYLTEPLWFPTLRLRPQTAGDWVMVAMIAAEAIVAVGALRFAGFGGLMADAARRFGAGRIAIFLGVTFALAVPVINYVGRGAAVAYLAHVALGAALLALHIAVLLAMSRAKSPLSGEYRISPIAPAAIAVAASLALGHFAFERMPHVEDEVAYHFQARTFAGGALTAPAPPEAAQAGLGYYLLEVQGGRWYSTTLPGWPAALALGLAVGLPWLVNPLLAGVSVLLAHSIARRMAGRDTADLLALMMAFSPWLLAAAGSLMPHTLTLALTLLAWRLILKVESGAKRADLRLLVAGLAMGWIFAARPLDGVVMGGLTGLWVLFGAQGSLRRALPYGLGCIAAGGLLLLYNAHITGSPFALPLSEYLDRHWHPGANAFGFGPDIGPPGGWRALDLWPGHSPLEAVLNTVNLLVSLQLELLGWPIGSLALILAFLLWRRKLGGFDRAMLAVLAVVILVMAFYWFAESYYFGPRYWFLAAFPMFYLSARGYAALSARCSDGDRSGSLRIESMLWLLCLFGLLVFTPWRGVAKYYEYGNFYTDIRRAAAEGAFGDRIVLMTKVGNEGSAFMLNDPWLRPSRPIFLLDRGALDEAALAAAFPGREIMRYTPDWARGNPRSAR